ncbi:MAG: oxygen-dependent coproporphyrinogen oxidase [Pelagibacterales bacterium]|nr:oxygen-dependent coproporphyrinogen oxidase [Pelagibacterales bacterium]
MNLEEKRKITSEWFRLLRDKICAEFEKIEEEFANQNSLKDSGKFIRKNWNRPDKSGDGGYGEMSLMKGNVFEKVGVNFSKVYGEFSDYFKSQIPGAENDGKFWASGISLVAHMKSPLVPAVHMNTRFICTEKNWFGGGADLNPMFENEKDTKDFHQAFKAACDKSDPNYYEKFKKWCDEYFFIKHRGVARGVGGIFYDYLNTDNFDNDFEFNCNVGLAFLEIFPKLVRRHMYQDWTQEQRDHQLRKRGLYAEFNLVYDRGTKFGLMTGGNAEAILMSLPPVATWD